MAVEKYIISGFLLVQFEQEQRKARKAGAATILCINENKKCSRIVDDNARSFRTHNQLLREISNNLRCHHRIQSTHLRVGEENNTLQTKLTQSATDILELTKL